MPLHLEGALLRNIVILFISVVTSLEPPANPFLMKITGLLGQIANDTFSVLVAF